MLFPCFLRRAQVLLGLLGASGSVALAARGNPVNWKDHGRDWQEGQCGNHDSASPINFDDMQLPLVLQKKFNYNYDGIPGSLNLMNDGMTINVDITKSFTEDDNMVKSRDVGGIVYDNGYHHLTRIDFHSGSEHTLKGRHLPLEMQLTHEKAKSKSKIIVSILIDCPDELKPTPALFLEKSAHVQKRRSHHKGRNHHRNGPIQPGITVPDPPNPNLDPLEQALDLTEADVDGMAEVALGPRVNPDEIKREDMDEVSIFQHLDQGVNWTYSHDETQSNPSLRKPKVVPATSGPFGLAASSRRTDLYQPIATYAVPPASDPEFSEFLQQFVTDELPLFEENTLANFTVMRPFGLNSLFDNVTFWEYGGTQTVPPCEAATWLVRREPLRASTTQVKQFFTKLHTMSEQAGNYRTLMPRNSRTLDIREPIPNSNIPQWRVKIVAKDDAERTFSGKRWGQDAVKIAETAQNYVRDIDQRLKRAAIAHTLALPRTPPPPMAPEPPPPGIPYSQMWLDPATLKRAMGTTGGAHAKAVANQLGDVAQAASQEAATFASNATYNNWENQYIPAAMLHAQNMAAPAPAAAPSPAGMDLSTT